MPSPLGAGSQHGPNPFRRIRSTQEHRHRQQHVGDRTRPTARPPRPNRIAETLDLPGPGIPPPTPPPRPAAQRIPPVASRDSTRTGSTSTVTIGASKHYSAAPRQAGQDFSGVPRTHQFLVTLMVHTNKINPATIPTATSAASMTNGHPMVVIQRDAQHQAVRGAGVGD